jgi:hypothetical protein
VPSFDDALRSLQAHAQAMTEMGGWIFGVSKFDGSTFGFNFVNRVTTLQWLCPKVTPPVETLPLQLAYQLRVEKTPL